MSVQQIPPPRMPQPEQWLSEHPCVEALFWIALVVGLIVLVTR